MLRHNQPVAQAVRGIDRAASRATTTGPRRKAQVLDAARALVPTIADHAGPVRRRPDGYGTTSWTRLPPPTACG